MMLEHELGVVETVRRRWGLGIVRIAVVAANTRVDVHVEASQRVRSQAFLVEVDLARLAWCWVEAELDAPLDVLGRCLEELTVEVHRTVTSYDALDAGKEGPRSRSAKR